MNPIFMSVAPGNACANRDDKAHKIPLAKMVKTIEKTKKHKDVVILCF